MPSSNFRIDARGRMVPANTEAASLQIELRCRQRMQVIRALMQDLENGVSAKDVYARIRDAMQPWEDEDERMMTPIEPEHQ